MSKIPEVTIGESVIISAKGFLQGNIVETATPVWTIEEAPHFCVGENPPYTEPKGWVLYHLSTGHAVFVSFPTKEAAGELAIYLEALPGRWDVKHPKMWLFSAAQALADKMMVEKKGERLTFPV